MAENIIVDISDGIMQIRIDRTNKKNALTRAMYTALHEALLQAEADAKVRVSVLTGNEDCFTAGNDLSDFLDFTQNDKEQPMRQFVEILPIVKKPLLAAVNGVAIGIGVTLLLHCDLVFAGENSQFQLPFINLGLIPEAGSTLLLPQLLGHQRAAELLLLGETFSADRAHALGIVNRVCPNSATLRTAMDAAAIIAAKSPSAVCLTKALIKQDQQQPLLQRMTEETQLFLARLESPEAKEAFHAFIEKRKADFSQF